MSTIEDLRALRDADALARKEAIANKAQRDIEIARLRLGEGLTLQAIGDKYGLTRERVRQIIAEL